MTLENIFMLQKRDIISQGKTKHGIADIMGITNERVLHI